jgi:hypothetical protein
MVNDGIGLVNEGTGVDREVRSDGAEVRTWFRSGRELVDVGVLLDPGEVAVRRVETTIVLILYGVGVTCYKYVFLMLLLVMVATSVALSILCVGAVFVLI